MKDVRITHRLTESPACLVADEHDMSGNLARLLKAAGQKGPASKPILEINPKHPGRAAAVDEEKKFDDWAAVLLDQALLAEGGQLDDPAAFVKRINELMLDMGAANRASSFPGDRENAGGVPPASACRRVRPKLTTATLRRIVR